MSASAALAAFRLFREKSEKLSESGFMKSVQSEPLSFNISWDIETGTSSSRVGPSDESIEAAVLTFRFFIQDNEPCSLRNTAKHFDTLHAAGMIEDATFQLWQRRRESVREYLDTINVVGDITEDQDGNEIHNEKYTNRRIMDIVVFGGLAHSNAEKTPIYQNWESFTHYFPLVKTLFIDILSDMIIEIDAMRRFIVIPAIEQINSAGQSSSGAKSYKCSNS